MHDFASIPLHVNEDRHQFELVVDRMTSKISYDISGDRVYLASAVVPPEQRNQGIAAAMTEKVLHWVSNMGLKAVPMCSYIQAYVHRHPEWKAIVA